MHNFKAAGLCMFMLLVACAGCGGGGDNLYVAVQYPAEYELPADVRVIAVTPFSGQSREEKAYAEMAVGILGGKLNETLGPMGSNRCQIVERANLRDLLREADLGDAGITDEATATRAGRILNADALIFGNLNVRQRDERGSKSESYYDARSKSYQTKSVPTIRRTVFVAMTFKVVRPETGQMIVNRAFEENYDSGVVKVEGGMFGGGAGSLPSMDEATALAVRKCVNLFHRTIAPHSQCFAVQLGGGKGELAKSGRGLASQGIYDEASRLFQAAYDADPEDHGSLYNLGLMKLMTGDLAGARADIQKAMTIKSEKKYQHAYGQVSRLAQSGGLTFRPATEREVVEHLQQGGRKKKGFFDS